MNALDKSQNGRFWRNAQFQNWCIKVKNGSNIVGRSLIEEFYEQIVAFAKSFGKGIKVNVKTEKEIISKLKTLKSKDSVFQKLLLEQITVNCYPSFKVFVYTSFLFFTTQEGSSMTLAFCMSI